MHEHSIPDLNMYLKSKLHRNKLFRQLEASLKFHHFFEDNIDDVSKKMFFQFIKEFFVCKTIEAKNLNYMLTIVVFFFMGLEFLMFSK